MTPEQKKNVEDWIAALESGKYKQCKDFLNKDDSFCCLGVLCEIQNIPKVENFCKKISGYEFRFITHTATIPDFDFEEMTGEDITQGLNLRSALIEANDSSDDYSLAIEILKEYLENSSQEDL